ncbi:MAG: M17 family peptidase N-terminal domain-containing protein, partial [Aestuariivirga sp.]
MKINFVAKLPTSSKVLSVIIVEGAALPATASALDRANAGRLAHAMKAASFTGKREQVLDVIAPARGVDRIILIGAGPSASLNLRELELSGGQLAGALMAAKAPSAGVELALGDGKALAAEVAAAAIASGMALRNYQFNTYKTKKAETKPLADVQIATPRHAAAQTAFAGSQAIVEGVHLARNLVNEPANVLFPVEFANRAKALAKAGVKVEILDAKQMKKLGMGALLGVAQGSPFEPRLVVMHWAGGKKGEKPIAFVGKGVTFDTGGVSIKPAGGMEDMKGDMGGAACVTGLMLTLAKRKAKCNVIGAIGLVENAIDGAAQRPGDIVKSMSGQTIAVLNTDAEGRLILADVLWYVQDKF